MSWATNSGDDPDRIDVIRGVFRLLADVAADALYPVAGEATLPLLLTMPLIAVAVIRLVARRRTQRQRR